MPDKKGNFTTIRIRKDTRERLFAWADRTLLAYRKGHSNLDLPCPDKVSLEVAINMLLDRDDAHRERSKRSKRSKSKPTVAGHVDLPGQGLLDLVEDIADEND